MRRRMIVLGCDRLSSSLELLNKHHDIKAVSILSNGALVLCREKYSTECTSPKLFSVKYRPISVEKNAPEEIQYFKDKNVVNLFGGDAHAIILERNGKVHGWGCNSHGQISTTDDDSEWRSFFVSIPMCIPLNSVVQVACGKSHTLFLLNTSELHALGSNAYGQLGADCVNGVSQPIRVTPPCLLGVPISLIVAGGWHSFCVTLSGRVFSWGRNDCGQLGLENVENQSSPQIMEGFSNNSVVFIAAGEQHNAILTRNGELFTFGQGLHGQLGHGDVKNELAPRTVEELEGSVVTQVACGAKHTVAYVPASNKIFVFGSNENGQLGDTKDACIQEPKMLCDEARIDNFQKIYTQGNVTCFLDWPQTRSEPKDFRLIAKHGQVVTLEDIFGKAEISNAVNFMFALSPASFLSCFNASFFHAAQICSIESPGIDFNLIHQVAEMLTENLADDFTTFLVSVRDALQALDCNPCDIEALRIYVIFPALLENIRKMLCFAESPQTQSRNLATRLIANVFIIKFMGLKQGIQILTTWYQSCSPDSFSLILDFYKHRLEASLRRRKFEVTIRAFLLEHLKILYDINNSKQLVCFKAFHLCEVYNDVVVCELGVWMQKRKGIPHLKHTKLLFDYPFLINARAKCLMLEFCTKQRLCITRLGMIPPNILKISRKKNIITEMRRELGKIIDLQMPLQVQFLGEIGQDDGALSKELFMLVFEQLLKSQYGLFVEDENSKFLWFDRKVTAESNNLYNFVGKLCGLSVYNSIVVNLNLPLALYKKLLGVQTTLSDLKELNPTFGTSLQKILTFVEDDEMTMEDLFGSFTTTDGVPLKEGGGEIPITVANREEYVDLYVKYLLDVSVQQQFEAFRSGFLAVFASEDILLELFTSEELMSMVRGTQNYDWNELKKNTAYHMFRPEDQTIAWFWEVLFSMSEEQKREFLVYLTGSNKIPISGLKMKVVKVRGCDKFLPPVSVCYNTLYLHTYSNKDILENRLKTAIKCKGFYLR